MQNAWEHGSAYLWHEACTFPNYKTAKGRTTDERTLSSSEGNLQIDKSRATEQPDASFQHVSVKRGESLIFYGVGNLDGLAANLAILDVGLTGNRRIQHH